jgi:hypothetical protein
MYKNHIIDKTTLQATLRIRVENYMECVYVWYGGKQTRQKNKSLQTPDSDVMTCSERGRVLCNEHRCDASTCQASDDVILMTSPELKANLRVTSGFRREVDENCVLPSCYAASSGDFLPTFRDNIQRSSIFLEVVSKSR